MTKPKSPQQNKVVKPVIAGLIALVLLIIFLVRSNDLVLYNPKGVIAEQQFRLMMFSTTILLCIAIPTLTLLYFFAWKYRETNNQVSRKHKAERGKYFAASLWLIPLSILLLLTSVVWPATHKLDPHKAIASDVKPLTVQVVAMRWKWLFIYPEQDIATVNYVQIPIDRPVQFELTADEAPMNSFWIPHLGGQLYAMTGHSNQLNLMATSRGDYTGQAAEINGEGFSGMKFMTRASSTQDFDQWVQEVKLSKNPLSAADYRKLLEPSEKNAPAFYSTAEAGLYDTVLLKYGGGHGQHGGQE